MQANTGDTVKVHYTLVDLKGDVVETTVESSPIEFILGEGQVISGFEKTIAGMSLHDKVTVTFSPEEAYGVRDEKKVFEYLKKNAPGDFDPRIGDNTRLHRPDGKAFSVTVLSKTEKGYMMDANHPLAGKELKFELELVGVIPKK
ncbi:MAG: FKBP-type peptidyl-prolyl cis-trans isomerase [Nitrospira sp.]|nr:FKBP-type peptidyl-prolyl cis-trans isomerase [bacterium]MBL7049631.1 FKBP-type peptidyl-prolyl cis-trans isomerase [Nitrospira sp.]